MSRGFWIAGAAGIGAEKAAALFAEALRARDLYGEAGVPVTFSAGVISGDAFALTRTREVIRVEAARQRGFVFGWCRLLRKLPEDGDAGGLPPETFGTFAPEYAIRGHQFGYRPKNNTCDAWMPEDFRRYFLDIMAFGANTVELMPGGTDDGERNSLMRLPENEMLLRCAEIADELDLDVSLWYPNCDEALSPAEAAAARGRIFAAMKRLNAVFPPGGDPGSLPPEQFLERTVLTGRELKKYHPEAQMWPSAQKPHGMPDWGDRFVAGLTPPPPEISGVITGPNEAMDIDTLRRRLPGTLPLRYYPDITHNVRCTLPVHFPADDWHFALAATLGRESINPRPAEFRRIHALLSPYCAGSVSYSEGANDDVNKAVWSALDWDCSLSCREILEDYARFFFPGTDASRMADVMLGLEHNWVGDPAENPGIDALWQTCQTLQRAYPALSENWRFVQLAFRALCDSLVRRRRIFETAQLRRALSLLAQHKKAEALAALRVPLPPTYGTDRELLEQYGEALFRLIGMQLSVKKYGAASPERGATLDTVDRPVTNRLWLENRLASLEPDDDGGALLAWLKPPAGTFVFSVSTDTCARFGGKPFDAYLNFRGDGEENDGTVPMELLGIYDHYFFEAPVSGLLYNRDYRLRLIVCPPRRRVENDTRIAADGCLLFRGNLWDAPRDEAWDDYFLPRGYCSLLFSLPREAIRNGCVRLRFSEDTVGVMFAQFRLEPTEG